MRPNVFSNLVYHGIIYQLCTYMYSPVPSWRTSLASGSQDVNQTACFGGVFHTVPLRILPTKAGLHHIFDRDGAASGGCHGTSPGQYRFRVLSCTLLWAVTDMPSDVNNRVHFLILLVRHRCPIADADFPSGSGHGSMLFPMPPSIRLPWPDKSLNSSIPAVHHKHDAACMFLKMHLPVRTWHQPGCFTENPPA